MPSLFLAFMLLILSSFCLLPSCAEFAMEEEAVIKAKLQSRFQDYVRDDKLLFPELDSQREEFYYLLDTNYDDVVDGLEVFHYFAARPENAVKSIQEISAMTKSFLQKYNRKNNNIITWQEFFDSRFTSA